jgi:hypothetical protein
MDKNFLDFFFKEVVKKKRELFPGPSQTSPSSVVLPQNYPCLAVFSLGWGLPPAWGCIPEQSDSGGRRRPVPLRGPPEPPSASRTGLSPSAAPRPRGFREAGGGGGPHERRPARLQFGAPPGARIRGLGSSRFARRYWGTGRLRTFGQHH